MAGGRLNGIDIGFGISGMPVIGKKAPTRPLDGTGNTSTLLSWPPDGVVHAAVANFIDSQITGTRESKIQLHTNFLSTRS